MAKSRASRTRISDKAVESNPGPKSRPHAQEGTRPAGGRGRPKSRQQKARPICFEVRLRGWTKAQPAPPCAEAAPKMFRHEAAVPTSMCSGSGPVFVSSRATCRPRDRACRDSGAGSRTNLQPCVADHSYACKPSPTETARTKGTLLKYACPVLSVAGAACSAEP